MLLVHERKGRRNRPGSPGIGLGPGSKVFNINQPDISYVKTTGQLDVLITFSPSLTPAASEMVDLGIFHIITY